LTYGRFEARFPNVSGADPSGAAVAGPEVVALATDRTVFKVADDKRNISVRNEATVLRMFVKLNGQWVPAGAALVPVAK